MKCIIVDDEPLARKGIQAFVEKVDFLDFKGFAKDSEDIISLLEQESIDLIFLDIEMPGLSGIDFVKTYEKSLPLIIFITAYHEHAVESYSLHAVDYLLKPTSFERFLDAVQRAKEVFESNQQKQNDKDSFFLRHEGQYKKIIKKEIAYISAMQNYVRLHIEVGRPLVVHYSMKAIREYLDEKFVPIHKSYIVNLDYIEAFSSTGVTIKGHGQLPIGRQYKKEVASLLISD
jgi:DNA-binding LytR/AlgR family response regulator